MTVALAGRAPATFEIKSANLPLVSLLLKSADLAALSAELKARFGDIPDFFDNDPLVLDLSPLQAQGDVRVDYPQLLSLLREYRVMPVAVKGGNEGQMKAALQAGLASGADAKTWTPDPVRHDSPSAANDSPSGPRDVPAPAQPVRTEPAEGLVSALVIDRPLRSGQQIYARGRDLVVLSMVNPGAEVIADGHIHVYAPLRGKAIAGARGNTQARIISLCMEPELISIAGVYRTSEIPLPPDILSKPTQVRLVGGAEGKLVMDPIK
ncbi:septum site-determining protein MinC [Ramlibacter sp. WS9]|uniref:septum site-determining protein MinC n=1 Tax=Ramlibacter sp. WS9 TaxID=1882741 RepID=UPI0011429580|nr:septum site-determining protein MinC [Ramlibacter sp. WS9]ROZ66215.1 septum site-determining protein MinC [Ramlibacter sp. WS9]